jgi:hypothetical protein
VTKDADPEAIGSEVVKLLSEQGLPWLSRFSGVSDIADFVNSDPARQYLHGRLGLTRAIVSHCRGQIIQARDFLEVLKQENKVRAYNETIAVIEARMNARERCSDKEDGITRR